MKLPRAVQIHGQKIGAPKPFPGPAPPHVNIRNAERLRGGFRLNPLSIVRVSSILQPLWISCNQLIVLQ
jgi:hypothetical protein